MTKKCKHVGKDGFHRCGSYAFNLEKDDIDQGDLCDVHYWENKAKRERVVFPTVLRKMWSGGEVQAWLDENVNKEQA